MPSVARHVLGRFAQRSFDHLLVTGRKSDARVAPPRVSTKPAFVHPKDRIPLWNISHGDRVRIISGGHRGKFGTVEWVDRENNRIYLMEAEFARHKRSPTPRKGDIFNDANFQADQGVLNAAPIHYSNVQLVLRRSPEEEARAEAQRQTTSDALPEVVAKRLRATNVHYDWKHRRWAWKRMAEGVAEVDPDSGHTSSITWAKSDLYTKVQRIPPSFPRAPNPLDTHRAVVHDNSFMPSLDSRSLEHGLTNIRDIEFVNVHGRARRTKRHTQKKLAAKDAARMQTSLVLRRKSPPKITKPQVETLVEA